MWRHFGGLDHHRIHLLYVACDMDTLKHSVRKDNFVSVDIISICAWRNRYICQSAKRQKLIKIEDLEVRPHFAVLSGATGDKVQVSRIDSKTLPYKRKWRVMSNDMHLAHVNVIFWLSRAFHSVEPKMMMMLSDSRVKALKIFGISQFLLARGSGSSWLWNERKIPCEKRN